MWESFSCYCAHHCEVSFYGYFTLCCLPIPALVNLSMFCFGNYSCCPIRLIQLQSLCLYILLHFFFPKIYFNGRVTGEVGGGGGKKWNISHIAQMAAAARAAWVRLMLRAKSLFQVFHLGLRVKHLGHPPVPSLQWIQSEATGT